MAEFFMASLVMVDGGDTELALQIAMGMEGSQIEVNWRHLTTSRKSIAIFVTINKIGLTSRGAWPVRSYIDGQKNMAPVVQGSLRGL